MKTQHKIVAMYYEIKNLFEEGHAKSAIARRLGLDRKTVRKYAAMGEQELERMIERLSTRTRKLQPYEAYVRQRIEGCPDCSAAQVEDWLKEQNPDFPAVSSRTIFSFVQLIRTRYHLPKPRVSIRACEAVDELPYGEQAQVDFGTTWMRDHYGNRIKVFVMVMVLSRSRQKFIFFTNQAITTGFLIGALERAFVFFGGMPRVLVFDQDAVVLLDENHGELMYTHEFLRYQSQRKFRVHMCRKADPQSKGKVENAVKYVKQNFLRGRLFSNLENLNQEGLQWLERTANAKIHGTTLLVPHLQWLIEKDYLQPFEPLPMEPGLAVSYGVRKDHTVLYHGNRYTVPTGTYQGPDSQVLLEVKDGFLHILDTKHTEIACFVLESGKGKLIVNTHHRRDRTQKVNELKQELIPCFTDTIQAERFLGKIRERFPRYVRDQFQQIKKTILGQDLKLNDQVLNRCMELNLSSSGEFSSVYQWMLKRKETTRLEAIREYVPQLPVGQLDQILLMKPHTSQISDYQHLIVP